MESSVLGLIDDAHPAAAELLDNASAKWFGRSSASKPWRKRGRVNESQGTDGISESTANPTHPEQVIHQHLRFVRHRAGSDLAGALVPA